MVDYLWRFMMVYDGWSSIKVVCSHLLGWLVVIHCGRLW